MDRYKKKFIDDLFRLHIDESYGRRDFRPQAVVVLYNEDKRVLVTESSKHRVWALPQEGVERGETLECAFLRCLAEELLNKHQVEMIGKEWSRTLDKLKRSSLKGIIHGFYHERRITSGRTREGFFGKEYFYSAAKYAGDGKFDLGPETSDYDWVESKEVITRMRKSGADTDKIELTKRALEVLVEEGLIV